MLVLIIPLQYHHVITSHLIFLLVCYGHRCLYLNNTQQVLVIYIDLLDLLLGLLILYLVSIVFFYLFLAYSICCNLLLSYAINLSHHRVYVHFLVMLLHAIYLYLFGNLMIFSFIMGVIELLHESTLMILLETFIVIIILIIMCHYCLIYCFSMGLFIYGILLLYLLPRII